MRGRPWPEPEADDGPAVVFVHGFGASTHDFEQVVLEPLAKTHRFIALDLYGFGWSERDPAFAYGWTLWADQLTGTLDALGIESATVVGHSMGGAVATVFAARYPDRIDRLVLADSFYPLEPSQTPFVFRLLQVPLLGELILGATDDASAPGFSAHYRERARAWYRIRGTRQGSLSYVRDLTTLAELAAAYPEVSATTLVLHGTADTFVPFAAMERWAPTLGHATIVPLAEGTHFIVRDSPEAFLREVDAYLRAR